ncbi:MAG: phosphoribosylanthranilate isomerase [Alphaproteobacteria bacterium]|nr:phosphoribosylanthranilate isomerase [Alphaproteobacteria bacterium]
MELSVKICGLTTPEALHTALDDGADHVGFIFFAKSPRHIAPEDAASLRVAARRRAKAVAVSVNADDDTLETIVSIMDPDMLQLHGSESPERVKAVKERFGLPVMKAFAVREAGDLDTIKPYQGIADRFLFDAKPPAGAEVPGGNGVAFDWTLLSALDDTVDYMLSGGLNADNIGTALKLTGAKAIDISSGVERAPGIKDIGLIDGFFRAVNAAKAA